MLLLPTPCFLVGPDDALQDGTGNVSRKPRGVRFRKRSFLLLSCGALPLAWFNLSGEEYDREKKHDAVARTTPAARLQHEKRATIIAEVSRARGAPLSPTA